MQKQIDSNKTIASGQDNNISRKRATHPTTTPEAQKRRRPPDNVEDNQDSRRSIPVLAGETEEQLSHII